MQAWGFLNRRKREQTDSRFEHHTSGRDGGLDLLGIGRQEPEAMELGRRRGTNQPIVSCVVNCFL